MGTTEFTNVKKIEDRLKTWVKGLSEGRGVDLKKFDQAPKSTADILPLVGAYFEQSRTTLSYYEYVEYDRWVIFYQVFPESPGHRHLFQCYAMRPGDPHLYEYPAW